MSEDVLLSAVSRRPRWSSSARRWHRARRNLDACSPGSFASAARVVSFEDGRRGSSWSRPWPPDVGDSISVDGACLTVVDVSNGRLSFDVVAETTTRAKPFRAEVNLEPAVEAGEPLGGHYVQGHVDGRAASARSTATLAIEAPPEILRYCVEKGSITVDGVALTIAGLDDEAFAVALVPHTLEVTTLGGLEPGDAVNLEVDVLAKYVERLIRPGGLTRLRRAWIRFRRRRWRRVWTPRTGQRVLRHVEEAIEDIRDGKFVVVVDAADRENEGDLTIAAQFATPEAINFMATHARGLICLCLTPERCDELALRPMTEHNEAPLQTAFTVSIEAREGVTTGISAADRARTIQTAIDPNRGAGDLVQPGHVFPLRARPGGVLERTGQTEAAVDLARLAGLIPAGVVCEVMNEDGTMARVPISPSSASPTTSS